MKRTVLILSTILLVGSTNTFAAELVDPRLQLAVDKFKALAIEHEASKLESDKENAAQDTTEQTYMHNMRRDMTGAVQREWK